ncbi:MAG TPA: hypothetical protein VGD67_22700, partial [Pseudonocardiaceae bacterium]
MRQPEQAAAGTEDATPLSARGLRIVRFGPDTVVVKRGIAELRLTFEGAADTVERLAGLADGTATAQRLTEAFAPELRENIRRLVTGLRARGLLRPVTGTSTDGTGGTGSVDGASGPGDEDPAALFWAGLATHAPDAPAVLAASSVLVAGTGP